jgi:hypothetical protein
MLGSLRARLIISFAAVVGLAVFLSGAGALFLLRDEQEATARERYGRHAERINERITTMLALGGSLADVREYADGRAAELGVRLLIVDDDLNVVHDTDGRMQGQVVLTFENRSIPLTEENGARYKSGDYRGSGAHRTLFAPPPEVTTV